MHLIKTSRNSHRARRRSTALSGIVALFAAAAVAVAAPTTASANWTLNASKQDTFACPVKTDVVAEALDDYALRVYTSTTIGFNSMWFSACRAWVYVDVVNKQGHVTKTFIYEPWAGPMSTNYLNANENAYGPVSNVSHIKIYQTRR